MPTPIELANTLKKEMGTKAAIKYAELKSRMRTNPKMSSEYAEAAQILENENDN